MIVAGPLYELAKEVLAQSIQTLKAVEEFEITQPEGAFTKIVAMALLDRTINNFKAMLLLLDSELLLEANILTKQCIEDSLWAAGLNKERHEFIDRMYKDEEKTQKRYGKLLLDILEESQSGVIADIHKQQKELKGERLLPSDVADISSENKLYFFYSSLASSASHPTMKSLDTYIKKYFIEKFPAASQELKKSPWEPKFRLLFDYSEALTHSITAIINVWRHVGEILEFNVNEDVLTKLNEQIISMLDQPLQNNLRFTSNGS